MFMIISFEILISESLESAFLAWSMIQVSIIHFFHSTRYIFYLATKFTPKIDNIAKYSKEEERDNGESIIQIGDFSRFLE